MSQLALSEGQPGNWEEPDLFLRMLKTVRFQEKGWQEPDELRDSRPVLRGPGGEIPLGYTTRYLPNIWLSGDLSEHITTHSMHLKNQHLVG